MLHTVCSGKVPGIRCTVDLVYDSRWCLKKIVSAGWREFPGTLEPRPRHRKLFSIGKGRFSTPALHLSKPYKHTIHINLDTTHISLDARPPLQSRHGAPVCQSMYASSPRSSETSVSHLPYPPVVVLHSCDKVNRHPNALTGRAEGKLLA